MVGEACSLLLAGHACLQHLRCVRLGRKNSFRGGCNATGHRCLFLSAAAAGEYRLAWRTFWIPGIVLFCVVALPWYIAVQLRNPEFFRVFILQHNLARFSTDVFHHEQPFWYFLVVILFALVPWTIFAALAVWETLRAWWTESRTLFESEDKFNVFLVVWLVVPVIFFALSRSNLPA